MVLDKYLYDELSKHYYYFRKSVTKNISLKNHQDSSPPRDSFYNDKNSNNNNNNNNKFLKTFESFYGQCNKMDRYIVFKVKRKVFKATIA